jgi:hypothetical protein
MVALTVGQGKKEQRMTFSGLPLTIQCFIENNPLNLMNNFSVYIQKRSLYPSELKVIA